MKRGQQATQIINTNKAWGWSSAERRGFRISTGSRDGEEYWNIQTIPSPLHPMTCTSSRQPGSCRSQREWRVKGGRRNQGIRDQGANHLADSTEGVTLARRILSSRLVVGLTTEWTTLLRDPYPSVLLFSPNQATKIHSFIDILSKTPAMIFRLVPQSKVGPVKCVHMECWSRLARVSLESFVRPVSYAISRTKRALPYPTRILFSRSIVWIGKKVTTYYLDTLLSNCC